MSAAIHSREPAFFDLIPWADPYIASLIEKLRQGQGQLLGEGMQRRVRAEAPPPLDVDFPTPGGGPDEDWSRRRTE